MTEPMIVPITFLAFLSLANADLNIFDKITLELISHLSHSLSDRLKNLAFIIRMNKLIQAVNLLTVRLLGSAENSARTLV